MPITKREQWTKLHDQLSKRCTCGISKMIQPLYFFPVCLDFLPVCLQFLWIRLPLSFTTRFIDESFVSYHLIWYIPLKKTHTVTSFFLECSKRRPPIAKRKQQHRKLQRLLHQSHFAVQISFLQSFQTSLSFKIPRLRRSVGQSE